MSGRFLTGKSFTRVHAPLVNRGTPQNPDLEVSAASGSAAGSLSATDYSHLQTLWSKPCCRVYHSVAQSITTATSTILAFDSERFDTATLHDTVTNNSRITVPTGYAGKWLVGATIMMDNTAGGNRRLCQIYLNGTKEIAQVEHEGTNTAFRGFVLSTLWHASDGDYFQVRVYQDSGGALNVLRTDANTPEFWAIYQGV